jgi:peptidoglycan L-alanyl-D-glutamate endopeptidase CwlK
MTFHLGERSRSKLAGVHPELVGVVERALALSSVDFAVTEGVRSYDRQVKLRAEGKSQTLNSKHLPQKDGFAHAVDVMAVGDLDGDGDVDAHDKGRTWDREQYEAIAKAFDQAALERGVAIRWGGRFKSFFDAPHFELM